MPGANPSATPSTATATTASRPPPNPNSPNHPNPSPPNRQPKHNSPPSHKLNPHNRPHRRTLPCPTRAPNLFSMYWPGRAHPARPEHPNDLVGIPAPLPPTLLPPTTPLHPQPLLRRPDLLPFTLPPMAVSPLLHRHSPQRGQLPRRSNPQPEHSTLLKNHPNPSHQSHRLPRGRNLAQPLVPRQVRQAFPFWHLFPRRSRERLHVLAPINPFRSNTYRNARKC